MGKTKFLLIILLYLLMNKIALAQDLLIVQKNMYIKSNTSLYIQGGMKADGSALINNNGTMHVSYNPAAGNESWINNASDTMLSGTGTVIFNSSNQQNISGNHSTRFSILNISNTSASGIVLDTNVYVSDTLKLIDGLITTGTDTIIVTSSGSGSITDYNQGTTTPSFINGNLRRYIATNTDVYAFPLGFDTGIDTIYYLSELENNNLTGISYLDAHFGALTNHINADLNVIESGNGYYDFSTEGVWFLTPDIQPTGGDCDIRTYIGNFSGLTDNKFAILKRPDNSITAADWDCWFCGIGNSLNLDNGLGRMATDAYALRKKLTTFSQFGIGKFVPNVIADAGPDTSICNGSSVQIGGSPTASNGSGNYSYNWNPSTGLDFTDIANPNANPSSTTEYFVTVTDTDNGFTSIDSIMVTVNPIYFYTDNQEICNGGTYTWHGNDYTTDGTYYDSLLTTNGCDSIYELNLTVNPTYLFAETDTICNGETYIWHGNDYTTDGSYYDSLLTTNSCDSIYELNLTVNPTYLFAETDTICNGETYTWHSNDYTITGTYYDSLLTTNGCDSIYKLDLTVNPNPVADAGPDTSVCGGTYINLTATGGTFYLWSTTEVTATITVSPATTTTYTVTVTDNNNCTDIDSVVVTVLPAPPADAGSDVDICYGDSTNLTGSGGVSYIWSTIEITATITVSPAITTTYTLTVTGSNGCTASDNVVVNVVPLSDATILQAGPFCLNNVPVNLTAADIGGVWSGTGITDGINGTFNPFVAGQGVHTIIYTISGMCGDSDTIDILVYPVPNISLEATDESCEGANDGSIDLTVNGGTLPYIFNWNNGETTEDISDLIPDTYIIIVTDSNGCSVSDSIGILGSLILCYEPTLYIPNIFSPNNDGQNDVLYVRGKGIKSLIFIIYDRWGEKVFETSDQSDGWDGRYKGKKLNTAVFTYYIDAVMLNNEIIKKKGSITLIR